MFVLRDPNTSPLELLKYDVILTSYAFIMSQYRKLCNYINRVAQFKENGHPSRPLERPSLSIFSEIFYSAEEIKFPYLILNKVTVIKNSGSITFAALQEVRGLADTCIMLSGSPVDNTWFNVYAYILLVKSHTITRKSTMLSLFASRSASDKIQPPRGVNFCRLIQLLNSFVVRRPETTIKLLELERRDVRFQLSPKEASRSNYYFDKYIQIVNISSKNAVQVPGELGKLQPWKHLTRATQHACHPAMVSIMHFAQNPLAKNDDDKAAADRLYEAEDIKKWITWREELTKEDK